MGPTRSAVLGNVLVPHVCEVVDPIDIVPEPLFRDVYVRKSRLDS